jgi:acid phosphatase (class A)
MRPRNSHPFAEEKAQMRVPKRRRAPALVLLLGWLALPGLQLASAAGPDSLAQHVPADTAHCVDPSTLDIARILPPPPAAGSRQERAELDELLRIQAHRSTAQAERAREDAEVSVFRFADALGNPDGFMPDKLPLTVKLFQAIDRDEAHVLGAAKREFARPRPFTVEPRLNPVIARPLSSSYPSGHSTWAYMTGLVLADMVPERRAQILERAAEFAHNRTVAGVHYPSDVVAGRLAGTALATLLFDCPPFERDEAAARTELRKALGLH